MLLLDPIKELEDLLEQHKADLTTPPNVLEAMVTMLNYSKRLQTQFHFDAEEHRALLVAEKTFRNYCRGKDYDD